MLRVQLQIMTFFEGMGMRLPVKPPLMLVDSAALNSAEAVEHRPAGNGGGGGGGRRGDGSGPVFHTRGLTLTQEYRQIRTVVRNRGAGGGLPFFSIRPETTHIEGPAHTEVRAGRVAPICCSWSPVCKYRVACPSGTSARRGQPAEKGCFASLQDIIAVEDMLSVLLAGLAAKMSRSASALGELQRCQDLLKL